MFDHPWRALSEQVLEIGRLELDKTFTADAARHVAEELIDQVAQPGPDIRFAQRTAEQADASIDVEAHPSGRDDAV